jgi:HD superfamily phosphodiesterase
MDAALLLKMADYFAKDPRRVSHALNVYGFARMIAVEEKLDERDEKILLAAAILHDIGIREAERKHGSTAGKYQEMEGPAVARVLLQGFPLSEEEKERILFLIGNHHSYSKIDAIDFQILAEADFLVNIQEEGLKKDAAQSIQKKIFKTKTGNRLLASLYL